MDLLERYLQAVRFWLPKAQQADISAELRDDIQSRIEDKEAAMGRPMVEEELIAILQQTGHPLWVAARYQPRQSLIGPSLFPLYEFVLKIVALGYLVPWILVWIGMMLFMPSFRAQHAGLGLLGTWAGFWSAALTLFGFVTLVFAVLERFQSSINRLQRWDPRKLPRVVQRKERVSRVESIFGLLFSVIFVVWWLGLPRYGHWIFWPAGWRAFPESGASSILLLAAPAGSGRDGAADREFVSPAMGLAALGRTTCFRLHLFMDHAGSRPGVSLRCSRNGRQEYR